MNITIYTSFSDVKDVWKRFEESGYYYAFQSYDWSYQWYQSFGTSSMQLCFVLVEKSIGEPILFLPFCIQEKCGVKILSWLGSHVTDYHCPLLMGDLSCEWHENFTMLWEQIKSQLQPYDVLHLEKQPEYIRGLKNPFVQYSNAKLHAKSDFIQMEGDWETFYQNHVKKRLRADSRRQRKL